MLNNKQPPDNARATPSEHLGWQQQLNKLESRWLDLGLSQVWNLRRVDFSKQLKRLKESTSSDTLFDTQEKEAKRKQQADYLEENFLHKMRNKLRPSFWSRVFRSQPQDIPELKKYYKKQGREREFDSEYGLFLRKTDAIKQRHARDLYNQQERTNRLIPQIRTQHRLFRRNQARDLRKYKQYYELVDSLPEDVLDLQIKQLADDYHFVGRSREWFNEFEAMISEILKTASSDNAGQNESRIRTLQNDFLYTMRSKFSMYWRYYELRQFCFKRGFTDLINQFSYFQNDTLDPQEPALSEFIHSIESALKTKLYRANVQERKKVKLLSIDHEIRLSEWTSFKHAHLKSESGTINIFNNFKPILNQCSEWQHELKVFCALIKVERLANPKREASPAELKDTDSFIKRMTERVNEEIATEVAFKILEQDLLRNGDFLDDLKLVKQRIAIEEESRVTQTAAEISQIKQRFIQLIWQKRAPSQPGAPVTALFSRKQLKNKETSNSKHDQEFLQ